MSFFKSALLAASLALAASSANAALVVSTTDGPREFGGLQEPGRVMANTGRFNIGNATWPQDRGYNEMFTY
jgi:hypothetical protein